MKFPGHTWVSQDGVGGGGYICGKCKARCQREHAVPDFLTFLPEDLSHLVHDALGYMAALERYSCEEITAMAVMLA
jgi:hypothetical protein